MPALVVFLLGIITDATTGLGDKVKAAAQMVSLGYDDLIPEPIRQHLPGALSGHTDPAPHPAAAQAHSAATAASEGGGHGWVWVLCVAVVLVALYLRPAVTARLSRSSAARPADRGGL